MQRNRPNNNAMRPNPAGENTAAPSSLPKNEMVMNRRAQNAGVPKPIPSTAGYAGRRPK